ncbi:MAG: class I SAM-dependent methyltransferase [Chitinophagaceae bacterium]|nr:class I SAM-dependent methyltransferase [Chitinophagaceae bacterium]
MKSRIKSLLSQKDVIYVPQAEDPFKNVWRDVSENEINLINSVKEFTMTSVERMVSLMRSIEYIVNNSLQGDIVECGVWKGGSMMLVAKKLLELKSTEKRLFLFDTFEGMSEPSDIDVAWDRSSAKDQFIAYKNDDSGKSNWCFSNLDEVKNNMDISGYPKERIFFIPGPVEKTLPCEEVEKISLLRLDTDWYESTKHELEHLYDKLVVGGILIIDDYGHWRGAKKAVDEFIKGRNLKLFLNRIDYTGRLAVKIN